MRIASALWLPFNDEIDNPSLPANIFPGLRKFRISAEWCSLRLPYSSVSCELRGCLFSDRIPVSGTVRNLFRREHARERPFFRFIDSQHVLRATSDSRGAGIWRRGRTLNGPPHRPNGERL